MYFNFKRDNYHPSPLLIAIQVFLLNLIIIGIVLLVTQKLWVPKLVQYILRNEQPVTVSQPVLRDPKNIAYRINDKQFLLIHGFAEEDSAPGSALKDTLTIFGEPAYGDIDGDGDEDALVLLVNDPGGSGTFYYVALALNVNGIYLSTNTLLLGDRIAPQTFSVHDGRAEINYADRAPRESFMTSPSMGKTLLLQVDPMTLSLIDVTKNFLPAPSPTSLE